MTDTKTTDSTKYPKAVYAVAGIGDLVYEQLRKLPAVTGKLQSKAAELRTRTGVQAPQWKQKAAEYSVLATDKAAELTGQVDPAKVRDNIVAGTAQAADQATKLYDTLVTRGERAFGADQPGAGSATASGSASATASATGEDVPAAAPVQKAAPKKAAKRAPRKKAE